MKKITVVGAEGFIGRAIAKCLNQNGYSPTLITRTSKIDFHVTDLVFYAAGASTPYDAEYNSACVDSDLFGLFRFLNELKNLKGRPLFVFFSSAGTLYDPLCTQPHKEHSPLMPTNFYGCGKLAQEAILRQSNWVDFLILRLTNIYGPHQKAKPGFGVIAHWAQKICSCEPIEIMGNSRRDYLYISDFMSIILKISKAPSCKYAGLTINVGSGRPVSLDNLYETFQKNVDRPIDVIRKPARPFDTKSVCVDITLGKELFSWAPQVSLSEGIKDVLESHLNSINT